MMLMNSHDTRCSKMCSLWLAPATANPAQASNTKGDKGRQVEGTGIQHEASQRETSGETGHRQPGTGIQHEGRQRETSGGTGQASNTKGDKGRQVAPATANPAQVFNTKKKETSGGTGHRQPGTPAGTGIQDKRRQRETKRDKGRQRETKADKRRHWPPPTRHRHPTPRETK